MLTSLGTYQCSLNNQSGLIKIEYVPTAWVDQAAYLRIVSDGWNWQQDVPLSTGSWLEVQAKTTIDKRIWNERQVTDLQGKYYNQTINATIPNLLPSVAKVMDQTADYRYLLRLTDVNGQKWILGTLDTPFQFTAEGTTGASGALKQHSVRWESETRHKAYGFIPVL